MNKPQKNQSGFSVVEALLIIIIIGLIGFVGWYVWHTKRAVDQTAQSTKVATLKTATKVVVPTDYTTYRDAKTHFSISYPKGWGAMTAADQGVATSKLTDYKFLTSDSTARFNGLMSVMFVAKEGYEVRSGKYGPTVRSTEQNGKYIWKVTEVNPADQVDKLGGEYHPKQMTHVAGVTMDDFSSADEGTKSATWIIEADNQFIVVKLPTFTSPDYFTGGPNAETDVAAYEGIVKTISGTIQLGE